MPDTLSREPIMAPFLRLLPRAVPRPWGGERAARRFGWSAEGPCGEWWLASSYDGTETPLADGVGDLATWLDGPGQSFGLPRAADFPLLVKILDCEQMLSAQVHPDDELARSVGQPRGKSEAWHVLEATGSARVWLGLADGVSPATLLDAVAGEASDDDVKRLLREVPVRAGQTIYVPAGTVHAIGPGLLLYEIQQNSDATYRIHDWGRGRELHVERARQALRDDGPRDPVGPSSARDAWTDLVTSEAFVLSRARVDGRLGLAPDGRFALLTVLSGTGRLIADEREVALAPGETLLVLQPGELVGQELEVLSAEPR